MNHHQRAGAQLRWARAGALGTAVVIVSTLAHTSAGGTMPPWWGMLLLTSVTTAALAGLLARPAGRARVAVLLAGGQALQHLAMTAVTGHGATPSVAHGHGHPEGAGHHAEVTASWVQTALAHLHEDLSGPNLAMAVAHLGAAAALGWWLASGERALWSLLHLLLTHPGTLRVLDRAFRAVRAVGAPLIVARGPRRAWSYEGARVCTGMLLSAVVVRRGPPRWSRA